MLIEMTARQVMDRIKHKLGPTWKDASVDVINAGNPDTPVTGIATSFTPSIDVLKRAVAAKKNFIITQQPAFYAETEEYLKDDPAYLFKKDIIDKNKLVLWRFYDNWNAREVDGQLLGLTKALDWDKFHVQSSGAGDQSYTKNNCYFKLPEGSLSQKINEIKRKLNRKAIRVIGAPETKIHKAALANGMFKLSQLQEFLKDPDVDLIVIAEAIEWESCEYFRDILTWKGTNKAMILLGREASEDPGYGEVASWLKTFIPDVPIEWISANEPFWIP